MSKKLNRRNAIGLIAGSMAAPIVFDPLRILIHGIVDGIILKAQASENSQSLMPRKYLHIGMTGGPPRWSFDLPLSPYKNHAPVPNKKVATSVVNGQMAYETVELNISGKKIYMPHLWGSSIPVSGGGEVPLASMLKNMMIIRGVDLISDGHESNYIKQLKVNPQTHSLHGLIADASPLSIPSVTLGNERLDRAFRSKSGIGNIHTSSNINGINFICSPFVKGDFNQNYLSRRQAMEASMDHALGLLGHFARSNQPGAAALYRMTSQAESILRKGIGEVAGVYNELRIKYLNLINATRNIPVHGLTDRTVSSSSPSVFYDTGYVVEKVVINLSPGNYLLGDILSEARINSLAENFAITEYLFKNNLSSTVSISVGSPAMLKNPVNGEFFNWNNDEHTGGVIPSTVAYSFYYRAIAACMYELSQSLGNESFKDTVIQLTSEFNRSARTDGSGSDHGFRAHCVSLYSGAILEPTVFGETKGDTSTNIRAGSWGQSANALRLGRPLHIEDIASTVAELVRIESPTPHIRPLVNEDKNTGKITNRTDESEKG